jgi:hypothetical protein
MALAYFHNDFYEIIMSNEGKFGLLLSIKKN